MKKIFLVLALAASAFAFNAEAQVKSPAAVKAAVEKAAKPTTDAKKAIKPEVWIKYGNALLSAIDAPTGNLMIGMGRQELQLLGLAAPKSETQVVVSGNPMLKLAYDDKNLYFDANGQLSVIEVLKPVVENAYDLAYEAFAKAAELDTKAKKTKDITEGLKAIAAKYSARGIDEYTIGKQDEASVSFEKSYRASLTAPLSQLDTNAIYNAAFTAWSANNLDRAAMLFKESLDKGHAGADGEAYAKLADIATRQEKPELAKEYLEEGFKLYPQSQGILVGLINYYISSGENTDRLFVLLDEAKKNEPGNASLYYVEGNIQKQLGNGDAAIVAYRKCADIDPDYAYGYIGEGIYWYDSAVELQTKAASELDDEKYMALMGEFEAALKNCIAPFEKAFDMSPEGEIKSSIAEYLKNAAFRFRTEADFQTKYEKYDNYLSGSSAE